MGKEIYIEFLLLADYKSSYLCHYHQQKQFSPSPRALSISKNIGASSAYTIIVVITTFYNGKTKTIQKKF